jgi:hypothetical protein
LADPILTGELEQLKKLALTEYGPPADETKKFMYQSSVRSISKRGWDRATGLLLGSLIVLAFSICGFAGMPEGSAAPALTHRAIPRPTPPDKPLDQEAASALAEELKATLGEAIEDEAAVTSIGEKWAARNIAGKTRSQILAVLFADVKSVVDDKAIQDKVWANWKNVGVEADEPEPAAEPKEPAHKPTPPTSSEPPEKPAANETPKPEPSEDGPYAALIKELKSFFPDFVDDADAIAAIEKKWDSRDLSGLTRPQVFEALFADVKSVIKDKQTQDNLWKVWSKERSKVDATDAGTPPTPPDTTTTSPENLPKTPDTTPTTGETTSTEGMIEFDPPPLSEPEMKAVMNWIGVHVSAIRLPFCWKQTYGNTAGEPFTCRPGLERIGLLCYPPCKPGFHKSTANLCTTNCPPGFNDIGAFCQKPGSYGRGTGWAIWNEGPCNKENPQGCEQWGAMWYPKCKPGFHNVACCVCSPDCPKDWTDTGTGCTKPLYGVGAGEGLDMGKCRPGFAKDPAGQLCYPICKEGFNMVGPVCWQKCPSQHSWDCGAACATNQGECAKAVVNMVFAPIMAAVNIVTLGSASAATSAGRAAQVAASASRLEKAFGSVKGAMTAAKGSVEQIVGGAENMAKLQKVVKIGGKLYKPKSDVGDEVDTFTKEFANTFEERTSPEIAAEIDRRFGPEAAFAIKRQWGIHHLSMMLKADGFTTAANVLSLVSIADPTGLVAVAAAFMHPTCEKDTPFPAVHPLYNR